MDYEIDALQVTATTALFYTHVEDAGAVMPFTIYSSDGTTVVESVSVTDPRWGAIEPSCIGITGLTPATTYVAKLTNEPNISTTFTTLTDDPKIATESQWADLASKVQSKAEIGSVLSTPSNVAYIATDNIINGAVTASKIDFSTFGTSGVLRFGNVKIMWGSGTVPSVPTATDRYTVVQFPEAFNNTPKVIVSCSRWIALEMVLSNNTTTTDTKIVVRHNQGSTNDVSFDWVAIG